MTTTPAGALIVVPAKNGGALYWEATWRHAGRAVKRRLGEAWVRPRATPADVKGWAGTYEKRPGNPKGDELTPQQAMIAMRDLIATHAAAAPTAGKPRTFGEAAAAWLDDPRDRRRPWTPETDAGYRAFLAEPKAPARGAQGAPARGRIMAAFGGKRVDRITVADIEKYLRGLDGEGLRAATVNKHHVVLTAVLAEAASRGWRTGNPAGEVRKRPLDRPGELEVFTVEQVEAIGAAAGGDMGALIVVAGMTGLRRGELAALRWRDVRFDAQALSVERAVSAGVVGRPKSGKGRIVPLAARPLAVLRELSARERFTAPDDLVFARADGGMRDPDAVSHAFVEARDAAKAPALRFHDLRHTFGALLAAGGIPVNEIQSYFGHASITTTQLYMRFAPRADAAARVTAALSAGA